MNTIVQLFPLECSDREQFINKYHQDPNEPEMCSEELDEQFPDGMFRFEKVIR